MRASKGFTPRHGTMDPTTNSQSFVSLRLVIPDASALQDALSRAPGPEGAGAVAAVKDFVTSGSLERRTIT